MNFLATLFGGGALKALVDALASPLENVFHDYIQGKISKEQLQEKMQEAVLAAFAQVESQFYDSLTKTYASFIQAASSNPVMTKAWSVVLYSQLLVLFWHQMVIPALVTFGFVTKYASSGLTTDWAYALVALCLGAPAIASRVGPTANWASSTIKGMLK